jgi:hypothetical protein
VTWKIPGAKSRGARGISAGWRHSAALASVFHGVGTKP